MSAYRNLNATFSLRAMSVDAKAAVIADMGTLLAVSDRQEQNKSERRQAAIKTPDDHLGAPEYNRGRLDGAADPDLIGRALPAYVRL